MIFILVDMRKRIQISFITIGLIVLISIVLWFRYSQKNIHDLPAILESGRLSVLSDSSSIGFSVNGETVSGFQYEIVKAFADSMGLELVISEQNDIKACVEAVQSGDYNLIAAFMPVTSEWKNELAFTKPLFSARQMLVQALSNDSLATKRIKTHFDLANDTVFLPMNSPHKIRLKNLSNELAEKIYLVEVKNASTQQMVRMVATGKIKQTICDEQLARKLQVQYPNLDVSLPIGFTQEQAWAVHPTAPRLLEKLNDFLSDFLGSSAYWEIYRKYYN